MSQPNAKCPSLEGPTAEVVKAVGKPVTVEAGKTREMPKDGFGDLANEQLKEIDNALAEMAAAAEGA